MSSNATWYFFGAAVTGIITAGVYIFTSLTQERRRHAVSQDLVRLNQQVSVMRRELEQLQALQKDR